MRCTIPACDSNHSSKGISFHRLLDVRFPSGGWEKAFSKAGLRLEPGSIVCSKHFLDKDVIDTTSGRQLRSGALPSVKENYTDKDSNVQCSVKVCRICFSTDCELYSMTTSDTLNEAYEKLTGLSTADEEHLPRYLCGQCAGRVVECARFRSRSLRAHVMLLDVIRRHGAVTVESIQSTIQNQATSSPSHNVNNDFLHNGQIEEVYTLTDGRGDMRFDDARVDENIDDIKTEIDYVIHQSVINGDGVTNDDVDEVKTNTDDLITQDNVIACPSNVDEDIDVDVVTIANDFESYSQYGRVSSPDFDEDVVVDDAVEKTIQEDKIGDEEFINEETNEPLVYSAGLYEHIVGHVLKITLRYEPYYMSSEEVSYNYIHSFVFVGQDVLEDSQARDLTSLPTRVTDEKELDLNELSSEDHQPPHDDAGPSIGDVLRCDICYYETVSDIQLLEHLKAHAADGSFMCDVCGYKTTSKNTLRRHIQAHFRFKCSCKECKQKFSRSNQLKVHIKTHLSEPLHFCDVCNKDYITKTRLSRHVKTHLGVKPFTCEICQKSFTQKYLLKIHLRVHTGEKPYSCDVCKKSFIVPGALRAHLRSHSNERPFSCVVCNKAFVSKGSLGCHMALHSGEKQFICDTCGRSFKAKSYLIAHLRIHTNVKPYSCHVCGRMFRQKNYLRGHLLVHTNDRPHSCYICGKKFIYKSYLRIHHLAVHSGNIQVSCEVCKKQLRNKVTLKKHMKIHTGERPYSCEICKKTVQS